MSIAEALKLPPQARAKLAESLWESLADPFLVAADTEEAEAIAMAFERDRQLDVGEVQGVSHSDMMAKFRR